MHLAAEIENMRVDSISHRIPFSLTNKDIANRVAVLNEVISIWPFTCAVIPVCIIVHFSPRHFNVP